MGVPGFLHNLCRFHSISVPSEWGLQFASWDKLSSLCFHSISVPSEWGLLVHFVGDGPLENWVFIRLVSPASGDLLILWVVKSAYRVFIRLVSPASGDGRSAKNTLHIHMFSFD